MRIVLGREVRAKSNRNCPVEKYTPIQVAMIVAIGAESGAAISKSNAAESSVSSTIRAG